MCEFGLRLRCAEPGTMKTLSHCNKHQLQYYILSTYHECLPLLYLNADYSTTLFTLALACL